MRIFALYVAQSFLKLFFLLLASFLGIYTLFDFIEKVDNFQESLVPASTMLSFFFLQIPELINLLLPMAVLLATILTLGIMAKNNEIVAVKSSGISIVRYTLPILLIAMALALGSAMMNETVLPQTKNRTNYIWNHLVEKQPSRIFTQEQFWYKGQDSIYNIGFYDPVTQAIKDVIYMRMDADFNLAMRIDAKLARFTGKDWVFENGIIQKRLKGGGYTAEVFKNMKLKLPETPADFSRLSKPSEEMSLSELAQFVKKIEREGYDSLRYRVDMQSKIAFPFVCVIMALWGVSLALFKEKGSSLSSGVIMGMMVALVYWVGFSYTRSIFGYSGVLPPILAVWLPNGVFTLGGLWFLSSIRQ